MSAFPSDSVLIERGKYATLASDRRAFLKHIRDDMEALADSARRVMQSLPDDADVAAGEILKAAERVKQARERILALCVVVGSLDELRPLAWGKEVVHD